MIHLTLLEKQEQTKPKIRTWKEIIKIRAEINKTKMNEWINKQINKYLYKESMKQEVGPLKR
jgi:hypothetical protein